MWAFRWDGRFLEDDLWIKNNGKKVVLKFAGFIQMHYLCTRQTKRDGRVAQLNRASDYGSEGYRFESCRDHSEGLEE